MLDVYAAARTRFTPDVQAHYVTSPRELTRWVRALQQALKGDATVATLRATPPATLVRLWAHEALRLFRCVCDFENALFSNIVLLCAHSHF
jgi:dynein heavy chain 1